MWQRYGMSEPHHHLAVDAFELDVSDLERPEVREKIRLCDLIIGIDDSRTENNEVCFFGRELLKDVSKGRAAEWEPGTRIAKIHYDQRTDSLEFLGATVQTLKGKHEYGE
jgi:hypothetical protein